jgi:hypothetical protein
LAVVLRKLKDCRPTNQLADNQCKFSPWAQNNFASFHFFKSSSVIDR